MPEFDRNLVELDGACRSLMEIFRSSAELFVAWSKLIVACRSSTKPFRSSVEARPSVGGAAVAATAVAVVGWLVMKVLERENVVYNANKLAKLVKIKKSLLNCLIYYQNKYERKPAKEPTMKTCFWGLWGEKVDVIDYYTNKIEMVSEEEVAEREKVISDPSAVVPVAFVSFKTRWGTAVCAQTQQSNNPTIWLSEWAPEPRDVYWDNLAIPYIALTIRRLLMSVAMFFLTFFFMIPIAFVQSLANIEGIEKVSPFLEPLIEMKSVKSIIHGFLPGIALKIFLISLPTVLMTMSKIEGLTSLSSLERRSTSKYHLFLLVNVFLESIITGTAMQQLHTFLNQPLQNHQCL